MADPEEDKKPEGDAVETAEQLKAALEVERAAKAELEAKLAKVADKEFNFNQLRKLADMSDDEKAKLSEKEKELIARQERLEAEQQRFTDVQVNTHKNDALMVLVGDDVELRKKVEYHYDRLKDDAKTRDEIFAKMRDAATIATRGQVRADPFSQAVAYNGGIVPQRPKGELTNEQQELASKLGISDEELKKYNN